MKSKAFQLAKKILLEKKHIFSKDEKECSINRFLYLIEKCEGKNHDNIGGK